MVVAFVVVEFMAVKFWRLVVPVTFKCNEVSTPPTDASLITESPFPNAEAVIKPFVLNAPLDVVVAFPPTYKLPESEISVVDAPPLNTESPVTFIFPECNELPVTSSIAFKLDPKDVVAEAPTKTFVVGIIGYITKLSLVVAHELAPELPAPAAAQVGKPLPPTVNTVPEDPIGNFVSVFDEPA